MQNTINIVDSRAVESAYRQRNAVYTDYIEDIVKKSMWRLSKHEDLDKILLNMYGFNPSNYMDTVQTAVFTKFKELKHNINIGYKDSIFTLEPKAGTGLETNLTTLTNMYAISNNDRLNMISPVNKTTTTAVANATYALLDFTRNKIGNYTKEFASSIKAVSASIDEEITDNSDVEFIEINPVQEVITYNGIISKEFSNNFMYSFNLNYDSSDLITAILNLDYENVDLNDFDMEIDTEFHKYLEEVGDDGLNSFKEQIESSLSSHLSIEGFLKYATDYKILGLKDLQALTFIWVAAINKYKKANTDEERNAFGEIAGRCEIELKKNIEKFKRYESIKTLALGKVINNTLYIYIFTKNYIKALEKQKDITNIIKGFFLKNQPSIINLKLDDIKPEDYNMYLNNYKTYLNNIRYKQILGRINDLRDGYTYGFMKSTKTLLPLIDNDREALNNIKTNVEKYISSLKIDNLVDVDKTTYEVVRNVIFPKMLAIIEGYISLGEKRFPNDPDGAMVFAILLTMTEIAFSMFKVKILNRVED